jgi:hypothetical protein
MTTGRRIGQMPRTVTRLVVAGAVAMVVLAGSLGSTAAQGTAVYAPVDPIGSQATGSAHLSRNAVLIPQEPIIPQEPFGPQEPTAPYDE